jgi:hypothetical protein
MNTRDDSPCKIKRTLIVGFPVLATHKSPLGILSMQMCISLCNPSLTVEVSFPLLHTTTVFFCIWRLNIEPYLINATLQILTSLLKLPCLVFFRKAFKYLLCLVLWCFIECMINSSVYPNKLLPQHVFLLMNGS